MPELPTIRQEQILKWLGESQSLSIDDLVTRLQVSVMTVHRDLDQLVKSGQVAKVHGGVMLAQARTPHQRAVQLCRACGIPAPERTMMIIQLPKAEPYHACCPHCGFFMLQELDQHAAVMAREFIYGRMVNAAQAVYLADSSVTLCCQPSHLCFASAEDARSFQKGFGGHILTFDEALQYAASHHGHEYHHS
ncbi:MAG: DeoR family transcriptional regulator [Anaerolineae bacterium]